MSLKSVSLNKLRAVIVIIGFASIAFGMFCISDMPVRIILRYLSQDNDINAETINALILAGTFSVFAGGAAAGIGLFWPELIERAAALPRSELLYAASLFGTNITVFFGLALGRNNLTVYQKVTVIVVIGVMLFIIERRIAPRIAVIYGVIFNRWLAFAGYVAASAAFFSMRFPFATFGRYLFSRDYPMFQYTVWLDSNVLKQGYLYGWEPSFSGGYPTFLNLRSLLIPYAPFSWLPPALGFHLMIFATYLSIPFLSYWVARELSDDRDMAVLSGWAGVGVMTGYMWHILHWGMMPTFTSLPFMMLTLGFFIRAMKGSRWGVFLSGLFWAPVAYIHLGHFAHVALALFILALVYTFEERSLRAARTLLKATALTVLFAAPYLIEFARFRSHVILTNLYSYPEESLLGMARILLTTVSHFIPTLMWHWSNAFMAWQFPDYGYFALFTVFSLVVAYLVFSGERSHRRAGLLYFGAILVSALSFLPKFQLSFQRMLYMAPPLMALALGFWMAEAKKRGHILPFYLLILLLAFYTRYFVDQDMVIPTLAQRGDFDRAVVEKIRDLDGNCILFENTASLTPYVDVAKEHERIEEAWDVHAPGFVFFETGKRFFAHPGYNPHPYYDLRGTYIASGTYDGRDVGEYPPEFFKDLWRKWGVEYLVVWNRKTKTMLRDDADYEKVMEGVRYTIYRFTKADPRAVATEGGEANVEYPDNFGAVVTLSGVPADSRVILRANWFPQWTADSDRTPVLLYEYEGQIAFNAPASDCTVNMHWPRRSGYLTIPAVALLLGIVLVLVRKS